MWSDILFHIWCVASIIGMGHVLCVDNNLDGGDDSALLLHSAHRPHQHNWKGIEIIWYQTRNNSTWKKRTICSALVTNCIAFSSHDWLPVGSTLLLSLPSFSLQHKWPDYLHAGGLPSGSYYPPDLGLRACVLLLENQRSLRHSICPEYVLRGARQAWQNGCCFYIDQLVSFFLSQQEGF